MSSNKNIVLACIDGSELSNSVCDYAAWTSKCLSAPLTLLHSIDHHSETAITSDLSGNIGLGAQEHLMDEVTTLEQKQNKLRIKHGKAAIEAAKNRVIQQGITNPDICLQHNSLIDSLVELKDNVRVMVVGVRGTQHEGDECKIGAELESIIRSVHHPIMVIYDSFKEPKQIMIAHDGSDASEKAVDMVVTSSLYKGTICHLVCVSKKEEASKSFEMAANKLRQSGGFDVITACLHGKADNELCDYQVSKNIDMTIMGAYSHTRIHDILLGSFTYKMLLKTKKPLLLLR